MTIRIVTDSACDLSDEELAEWGIGMVPLSIRFGDDEFVDRTELSTPDFYRRLASSEELPETSAPAPGAFVAMFNQMASEGATGVVCINLSEALSATIQSARTAAKSDDVEIDVRVVNSKSVTGGLGSIVLAAASAARDGASIDEIVALAEGMSGRTRVYATLNTLEYLKKGGRIGGAQAALGAVLSIKPLLDLSSGEVVAAGRQRTRRRSLEWVREQLVNAGDVENLAILHSQADDMDDFLATLQDIPGVDKARVNVIGAVIGTHGGPGVIGITYQVHD
ncbi:MAG: DegV family protein [Acidimicrobiales bacterium]|nr:DegV family protein [Acidimicrobiales bacterium]RZV47575.1 MAG: DegV family protein [Acidimicrobiales bacterium]